MATAATTPTTNATQRRKELVSLSSTRLQRDINASTVSLKQRLKKDREHVQT
jgi:hypothetical protein